MIPAWHHPPCCSSIPTQLLHPWPLSHSALSLPKLPPFLPGREGPQVSPPWVLNPMDFVTWVCVLCHALDDVRKRNEALMVWPAGLQTWGD